LAVSSAVVYHSIKSVVSLRNQTIFGWPVFSVEVEMLTFMRY